jgi:S-adenosylmethionine hydrolase
VIYIDHYGNAATGLRAAKLPREAKFRAGNRILSYSRTFEDAKGAFWYENSMGLVEIAVSRGSAAQQLGLKIGSPVVFRK